MATIVQDYGPIYGEVVNGTVQGRPNGSVYVPLSNTISLSIQDLYIKLDTNIFVCNDQGNRKYTANVVAQSQDLASNINIEVADVILINGKLTFFYL